MISVLDSLIPVTGNAWRDQSVTGMAGTGDGSERCKKNIRQENPCSGKYVRDTMALTGVGRVNTGLVRFRISSIWW